MDYFENFKVGDKIYKKMGETFDKTIVYEIKEIWQEEEGNWHDGYQRLLYVKLDKEPNPYLLGHKILGSSISIYCIKANL